MISRCALQQLPTSPRRGKQSFALCKIILLSWEASRCDFPLAAGAVCAGQSGAVSSARLRAIPVLKEGMQPTCLSLFFFFFWLCVVFFLSFWQTSLSI